MPTFDQIALQRLRYRQGQMLRSRDFRDQAAMEAQLRWWHNRALHEAFGIAEGLGAELSGQPGHWSVTIGPGLAYDGFGCELIVTRAQAAPLPAGLTAGRFTLLVQFRATAASGHQHALAGACLPGGCVSETPELHWQASSSVTVRDGVPLAWVTAEHLDQLPTGTTFPVSISDRLRYDAGLKLLILMGAMSSTEKESVLASSADGPFQKAVEALFQHAQLDATAPRVRPLARPRLASGTTRPGSGGWEVWKEVHQGQVIPLGLQVRVDTAAAGFTQVPCYFAWAMSPLSPFEHIDQASIHGFILRFWIPLLATIPAYRLLSVESLLLSSVRQQENSICWLGIQSEPGSEPGQHSGDEVNHGHI
jgi:hypothetical protein